MKSSETLAKFLFRKIYKNGYKEYVSAEKIIKCVHKTIYNNRKLFAEELPKTCLRPLRKITDCPRKSKKHVISFLRLLAKTCKNRLVYEKRTKWSGKKYITLYYYRLVIIDS